MSKKAKIKHWSSGDVGLGDLYLNFPFCGQQGKTELVQDRRKVTCKKCIELAKARGFTEVGYSKW